MFEKSKFPMKSPYILTGIVLAALNGCNLPKTNVPATQYKANSFESANNFLTDYLNKLCDENKVADEVNFTQEYAKLAYQTIEKSIDIKKKILNKNNYDFYYFPPNTKVKSYYFSGAFTQILYFGQNSTPPNSQDTCLERNFLRDEFTVWENTNEAGYYLIVASYHNDGSSYDMHTYDGLPEISEVIDHKYKSMRAYTSARKSFENGVSPSSGGIESSPVNTTGLDHLKMVFVQGEVYDDEKKPIEGVEVKASYTTLDPESGQQRVVQENASTLFNGQFMFTMPCDVGIDIELSKKEYLTRQYQDLKFNCDLKSDIDYLCIGTSINCNSSHQKPALTSKSTVLKSTPQNQNQDVNLENGIFLRFTNTVNPNLVEDYFKIYDINTYYDLSEDRIESILSNERSLIKNTYERDDFTFIWNDDNSEVSVKWKNPPIIDDTSTTLFVISILNAEPDSVDKTQNSILFLGEEMLYQYLQFTPQVSKE